MMRQEKYLITLVVLFCRYCVGNPEESGLTFVKICQSEFETKAAILADLRTSTITRCAVLCRLNYRCHFISAKKNSDGSLTCKFLRPEIFCRTPSPNGIWKTYAILGNCVCKADWTNFNQTCYKFLNTRSTWMEARDTCYSMDSILVSVTSVPENEFVGHLSVAAGYGLQNMWLGGHDSNTEGNWEWLSGEPFVDLFPSSQPDGGTDQNYLAIWQSIIWFDKEPDDLYYFVCETVCVLT